MLKKSIYGVVAALGLALSAQVALADSQYWNGMQYASVTSLPFPTEVSRDAAPIIVQDWDQEDSGNGTFPPSQTD